MEINNKKIHLSRIRVSFMIILFAMCLSMNVLIYNTYSLCELLDKTTVIAQPVVSESIAAMEGSHNTAYVKASYLNNTFFYNRIIKKDISSVLMTADISKGFNLSLFLLAVILFFFLTFFILLPDKWTLINKKVRLNN